MLAADECQGRKLSSKIGHCCLRHRARGQKALERVRIFGADLLHQGPLLGRRQSRELRDIRLRYSLFVAPEALSGVPGRGESSWVLDMDIHFERLALVP